MLTVAAAGCASSSSVPATSALPAAPSNVERYLPLLNNSVLSYETYIEDTNEHGLLVFEISRPRPALAELSIAGQVRKRYYFEPAGVRSALGGYLLKAPLSVEASWAGDDGQVKVVGIGESIDVPAGKFSGCVRTVELAKLPAATRTTTTVFCPDVGITWLQIEAVQEGTSVLERLRLKSFGARFSGI